jgi:predicted DNA-binding antitoxin AbrB/MazE fold protein
MEKMDSKEHFIGLKTHESELRDQSGYARVHSLVHEHLDTKDREHVEVINKEGKAILLTVSHDSLIARTDIRLGKKDMEKLDLAEGEEVHVRVHKTIIDSATDLKDKIVSKFKKGDEESKGDD